MSSDDELTRKDQNLLDGIKLAGDAHEEGRLEALHETVAGLNRLVEDLQDQIRAIEARRAPSS